MRGMTGLTNKSTPDESLRIKTKRPEPGVGYAPKTKIEKG